MAQHALALVTSRPPLQIPKVDMYHYQMAAPAWELAGRWWRDPAQPLVWWNRTYEEELVPVVTLGANGQLVRAVRESTRKYASHLKE